MRLCIYAYTVGRSVGRCVQKRYFFTVRKRPRKTKTFVRSAAESHWFLCVITRNSYVTLYAKHYIIITLCTLYVRNTVVIKWIRKQPDRLTRKTHIESIFLTKKKKKHFIRSHNYYFTCVYYTHTLYAYRVIAIIKSYREQYYYTVFIILYCVPILYQCSLQLVRYNITTYRSYYRRSSSTVKVRIITVQQYRTRPSIIIIFNNIINTFLQRAISLYLRWCNRWSATMHFCRSVALATSKNYTKHVYACATTLPYEQSAGIYKTKCKHV